jgi:hypothetical protein
MLPERMSERTEIDWGSASVDDGRLTVEFAGKPSKEWAARLEQVIRQLARTGGGWGEIEVKKAKLRVDAVTPGSESALRHFLEGAILQADADQPPEADSADEERSEPDQRMTDAFRAFGD